MNKTLNVLAGGLLCVWMAAAIVGCGGDDNEKGGGPVGPGNNIPVPQFTVSFDWDNAVYGEDSVMTDTSLITYVEIDSGKTLGSLDSGFISAPEKDGYVFLGWFDEDDVMYTATTPPITKDIALTAKWEEIEEGMVFVIFDPSGGVMTGETIFQIPEGSTLGSQFPVPPVKEGHTFAGWFGNDGTRYSATTLITASVTLTAKWDEIKEDNCILTLKDDTVKIYETQIVCGEAIGEDVLTTPEKDGYTFVGWFDDEDVEYDAESIIEEDVTLAAVWTMKSYTVTFDLNYIGAPLPFETDTTVAGWMLDTLPIPAREGYTFDGWFTTDGEDDDEEGEEITDTTAFTSDTTVYAQWTVITRVVIFETGIDTVVIDPVETTIEDGYKIPAPTKVLKKAFDPRAAGVPEGLYKNGDDYVFAGWYLGNAIFDFNTMTVNSDTVTLTARWNAPAIALGGTGDMLAKTITYLGTLPTGNDTFALVLNNNLSITGAVGVNKPLTIIGRSNSTDLIKITGSAAFALTNSRITFEDVKITRVFVNLGYRIILAGATIVDTLTLEAVSNNSLSNIDIVAGWTGSVGRLDLYTDDDIVQLSWWKDRAVVQPSASDGALTKAYIDSIKLGFLTCNNNDGRYTMLSGAYSAIKISDSGADIGKLIVPESLLVD